MRCCDSLPPISPRFVSFAWRYHRCVRCSSPPAPDAEPWINLELVGGISSRRARWKRQGLPSSRRNPCDHSPYSSDPGVTRQAEWTMSELPGAAPATDHDEGSPRVLISGLNRTAFDLAVYASQGRSPTHHARLASGCWSGSTGRDWLPAGFHLKGFKLRLSSSPELLRAMSVHFFLDKRPDTNCLRETQIFLPPLRGALVDHYTPGSHSPGARPTAEEVERSGRTGGLMGRSGPSASQAGEVSTAGRRIGTRLSSTRDSLQKGPLNETRGLNSFVAQENEKIPKILC